MMNFNVYSDDHESRWLLLISLHSAQMRAIQTSRLQQQHWSPNIHGKYCIVSDKKQWLAIKRRAAHTIICLHTSYLRQPQLIGRMLLFLHEIKDLLHLPMNIPFYTNYLYTHTHTTVHQTLLTLGPTFAKKRFDDYWDGDSLQ